jgi:hypothetical protein
MEVSTVLPPCTRVGSSDEAPGRTPSTAVGRLTVIHSPMPGRANGYEVNDRGRIPNDIREAFEVAN